MGTRDCPYCAERISEYTDLCPECNLPIQPIRPDRTWLYALLGGLLFVGLIVWLANLTAPRSRNTPPSSEYTTVAKVYIAALDGLGADEWKKIYAWRDGWVAVNPWARSYFGSKGFFNHGAVERLQGEYQKALAEMEDGERRDYLKAHFVSLKNYLTAEEAQRLVALIKDGEVSAEEEKIFWSDFAVAHPRLYTELSFLTLARTTRFTEGSSQEAVLRIQGPPSRVQGWRGREDWHYGKSLVRFDGVGRVQSWIDSDGDLKWWRSVSE